MTSTHQVTYDYYKNTYADDFQSSLGHTFLGYSTKITSQYDHHTKTHDKCSRKCRVYVTEYEKRY